MKSNYKIFSTYLSDLKYRKVYKQLHSFTTLIIGSDEIFANDFNNKKTFQSLRKFFI